MAAPIENSNKFECFHLKDVDIFGKPIVLNLDGKNENIKTTCGGIMTILMMAITARLVMIEIENGVINN